MRLTLNVPGFFIKFLNLYFNSSLKGRFVSAIFSVEELENQVGILSTDLHHVKVFQNIPFYFTKLANKILPD